MTLHTDTGFSTGTYTVTRDSGGTWDHGRFIRSTPTVIANVDMDVQSASGLNDEDQVQGQETSETRTIYTDFQLFVSRPSPSTTFTDGSSTHTVPGIGLEADQVEIEGEPWVVSKVNHYPLISGHYVVTVTRLYPGRAT